MSFEVMDRLGLRRAFTFDRDFCDCGYDVACTKLHSVATATDVPLGPADPGDWPI